MPVVAQHPDLGSEPSGERGQRIADRAAADLRLQPCDCVKFFDLGSSQSCQRAKHRSLNLSYFGILDCIHQGILCAGGK
eukprot:5027548-Amphidinium_carterae.1